MPLLPPRARGRNALVRVAGPRVRPLIAGHRPVRSIRVSQKESSMTKMSIRKAGTIRLTTACYYGTCSLL